MSTEGVPEYEIVLENGQRFRPTVPTSFEMFERQLKEKTLALQNGEGKIPFISIWQGENETCIHVDSIASFTRESERLSF